jgi:hypothetical protein
MATAAMRKRIAAIRRIKRETTPAQRREDERDAKRAEAETKRTLDSWRKYCAKFAAALAKKDGLSTVERFVTAAQTVPKKYALVREVVSAFDSVTDPYGINAREKCICSHLQTGEFDDYISGEITIDGRLYLAVEHLVAEGKTLKELRALIVKARAVKEHRR